MSKRVLFEKADGLVQSLLALGEKSWITGSDIETLLRPLRVSEVEAEIYLLRELTDIARLIPLKLFTDLEQRERLIDALQEALDDAVNREEQALEEDG